MPLNIYSRVVLVATEVVLNVVYLVLSKTITTTLAKPSSLNRKNPKEKKNKRRASLLMEKIVFNGDFFRGVTLF